MDFLLFLVTFVLFFLLTPGVLITLPPKGSKLVVGLVHAVVYAIVWSLFAWLLQSTKKAEMEHDTKKIEITFQKGEPEEHKEEEHKEEEPKEHKEHKEHKEEPKEHRDIIEHVGANWKAMNYGSPF
tara:strand:+ start:1814 stop:2191 length:378 start_codon:yes stop_codon:yes gene_type:complete